MTQDSKFVEHLYGDNYRILDDVFLQTYLAELSKAKTKQPLINEIVSKLYEYLLRDIVQNFPIKQDTIRTRMADLHPKAFWTGNLLESETKAIVVDIARAGIVPAETCFRILNQVLNPELVRQDHIFVSRKSNEQGQVTGLDWSGSKIGGDKDDSIVLIPDPMAATGTSISNVLSYYKNSIPGLAKKFIAIHLIVTPNYIQRLKQDHPDLLVYALRLDRGTSSLRAFDSIPGTYPEEENGLNDHDYIIPGAGGLGELMNNSFC